jgi:hypothetical protein
MPCVEARPEWTAPVSAGSPSPLARRPHSVTSESAARQSISASVHGPNEVDLPEIGFRINRTWPGRTPENGEVAQLRMSAYPYDKQSISC